MALLLWVIGCRGSAPGETPELTVFAASSLTEAFTELAQRFEANHPPIRVRLHFAGSQVLRMQIEQGARADLFASADPIHLEALVEQGLAEPPRPLVENELVLAVPRENPAAIHGFDSLDRASRLVIGSETVPIGRYTRQILERARPRYGEAFVDRVWSRVVSQESNTRQIRAKVVLGEADAAFLYRTDVRGMEELNVIALPSALTLRARYPVARLSHALHPQAADAFMAFALQPEGRAILASHGFTTEPR